VNLTTHFHLVPRLRTSGAIPLLPIYAFTVRTTTVPLHISLLPVQPNIHVETSELTALNWQLRNCNPGPPITGHEGPGVTYSSILSLTSALDGVGGQRHAPAALPPGETRYPLHRVLGGPHDRSGRVRKIAPPPEFDPRTIQPVASRYAD